MSSPTAVVVVPCFNEARRLPATEIKQLVAHQGLSVLAVNDGSTDDTLEVLTSLARDLPGLDVVDLLENVGKGEAVRQGLLRACATGAEWVGYCDADMATPATEVIRLLERGREADHVSIVLASRVNLLGTDVERSAVRHYLGRIFATGAGVVLRARVYDTQCGAKFFRNDDALRHAISRPFHSRWSFDVELLGRMIRGGGGVDPTTERAMVEVPLARWQDVRGSKLSAASALRSGLELGLIAHHLRRWR